MEERAIIMSDFFYSNDNPEVEIMEMASRRATLFVSLTHTAAQVYGVTSPTIERRNDAYYLYSEGFCELVEKVFLHPINILCVWAHYGAGFYHALKGESFNWHWRGGNYEELDVSEVVEIAPYGGGRVSELPRSGRIVGPYRTAP
jgi:hypothetical protein